MFGEHRHGLVRETPCKITTCHGVKHSLCCDPQDCRVGRSHASRLRRIELFDLGEGRSCVPLTEYDEHGVRIGIEEDVIGPNRPAEGLSLFAGNDSAEP